MFDLARRRPNLGERLGFFVVMFLFVASLLGPIVALMDSQRHQPAWSDDDAGMIAHDVREAPEVSAAAQPCDCSELVLRIPAEPATAVSPSESL